MFDDPERRQAIRPQDPPLDIEINLSDLFPPDRISWGRDTPIWVRSTGINVAAPVTGQLHAWVLSSVGRWWALCEFTVTATTGGLTVPLRQLVPADAVRPV